MKQIVCMPVNLHGLMIEHQKVYDCENDEDLELAILKSVDVLKDARKLQNGSLSWSKIVGFFIDSDKEKTSQYFSWKVQSNMTQFYPRNSMDPFVICEYVPKTEKVTRKI